MICFKARSNRRRSGIREAVSVETPENAPIHDELLARVLRVLDDYPEAREAILRELE